MFHPYLSRGEEMVYSIYDNGMVCVLIYLKMLW